MRLFSNRSGQKLFAGSLSGRVFNVGKGLHVKIAGWLNAKTKGYSARQWLLLLILFCGIAGSVCMYLIISSI